MSIESIVLEGFGSGASASSITLAGYSQNLEAPMAAPTVYRSSDVGVPVLAGTTNDQRFEYLFNILKACLVNGYGAQPAAGWQLVGEVTTANNREIAFRNASNTGCVKIKQNPGNAFYLGLACYDSMTDIATGTNGVQHSTALSGGWNYQSQIPAFDIAGELRWILVADTRTFILHYSTTSAAGFSGINTAASSQNNGICYAGEYNHFNPSVMAVGQQGNFIVGPANGAFGTGGNAYEAMSIRPNGVANISPTSPVSTITASIYSDWGKTLLTPMVIHAPIAPAVSNSNLSAGTPRAFGNLRGLYSSVTVDIYHIKEEFAAGRWIFGQPIVVQGKTMIPLAINGMNSIYISLMSEDWPE